jgi:hypothetical protein
MMTKEKTTMDTPTLRILDTISSYLGDSLSINQLTERIKATYGTGHYANIYRKLQDLKKEGLLSLDIIGKSSIIKLNFQNYLLIDLLAEMEIEKKMEFLKARNDLFILLAEMDKSLNSMCSIKSISSINPVRNIKLNRIELLFLLRKASNYHDETVELYREMQKLQNKYNLRIDSLILDEDDFSYLVRSNEINPLREALTAKIVFFCPQAFWSEIRSISEESEIRTIRTETRPADISDLDLVYNLSRFGYKEFGSTLEQGKKFCIEYLVTALLLQSDARRTDAVPIVLAKNTFRSNLLTFLSQKFGTSGKLLRLSKALQNIKPNREVEKTTKLLEILNVNETQADERSILEKMRHYNAT